MDEKKKLRRIAEMRTLLDRIAYISLIFDMAIAVITLLSLRALSSSDLAAVLAYVNYGLTAIVVLGALLFVLITVLSYYDRIVGRMLRKV